MQVTITIDGAALRRATFLALAVGGVFVLSSAHASSVTIPNSFTTGTAISAAQMNANFAALETAVDDNDARLTALEARFAGVTRPNATTIQFAGVNVQLINGGGTTHAANGNGNLILGYNTGGGGTGSHNLVIGDGHTYGSTGGVLTGAAHVTSGQGSVALGGQGNSAAQLSVIVGGSNNLTETGGVGATPEGSVIVGGMNNEIQGVNSAILGGDGGRIEADPLEPGIADGNTVTFVGVIDGAITGGLGQTVYGENHATSVGNNCTGIAVGMGGGFVEVGHAFRKFLGIGNPQNGSTAGQFGIAIGAGQNSVNIGSGIPGGPGQPPQTTNLSLNAANIGAGNTNSNINIGVGSNNVIVGDNASNASFGNGAQTVNVGNNATTSVNVGGTANTVNLGIGATSTNVGP